MLSSHPQQHQGTHMSYLQEFQTRIHNHNFPSLLKIWEEYCSSDEVDGEEVKQILKSIKSSEMAELFGRHVERILPLWQKIEDPILSAEVLKYIIDLQTTNSEQFRDLAYNYLEQKYGNDKFHNEKMRLVGLRGKENFQGALSSYELLCHMQKGNHVFHSGGWGVGEILDVSMIREQLSLEFDYVPGRKDLSFSNAFKTLIPIPNDHFLALRFGNPDALEEKARDNSVETIRMLLRDLGPKTAGEIKDELCELVIPAKEWSRWWQGARAKIKKDTMIHSPEDLKEPFYILGSEVSHEERLQKALEAKPDANTLIQMVYSFIKDFPEALKNGQFKATLQAKLNELLSFEEVTDAQELQIYFFLQDLSSEKESAVVTELLNKFSPIEEIVLAIPIQAFKKRALIEIKRSKSDWKQVFLNLFLKVDQAPLRDYILTEMIAAGATEQVKKSLESLCAQPAQNPEAFIWYFQKIMAQSSLPFADQEGKNRFFESLLILLSYLEQRGAQRDLIKKIHTILSGDRYAIVRQIMQGAGLKEVKEFLLLSTKCHSLSDHDIKILHSLAEVVHPSLAKVSKRREGPANTETQEVLWTTKEGYHKLQHRIQQIATVETIENAKEIEVARSHGDLRENAEFKSALEKRDRLQTELKFLSEQLNRCRILTKEDISLEEVGVGAIVDCEKANGETVSYTFLGPWDADPDQNILSFQSKLAQSLKGLGVGDKFQLQKDEYKIVGIRSAI